MAQPHNKVTDFNPLQRVVWPDKKNLDRFGLYAMPGNATIDLHTGTAQLAEGEALDLCSFFNAFSHQKWRELCAIEQLTIRIEGSGLIKAMVLAWTPTAAAVTISEHQLQMNTEEPRDIHLDISKAPGSVLSLQIHSLANNTLIQKITWGTPAKPRRPVSLNIVVTTFNRPDAIQETIKKLKQSIIPYNKEHHIKAIIINNGNDIPGETDAKIKIIKNKNLGGAGGFTRGLLETIDEGTATHCLFMDDDASCEAESIYRTVKLLSHCISENAAVAGAMFHTDRPTIQYEKGAIFSLLDRKEPLWKTLGLMRDLTDRAAVVSNDGRDECNYGAWWYFCFPIASAHQLPFPFFVRGDDTDFSLSNDFKILTLNGVACWSENFGYKLTPTTYYLAWRSWMALAYMHSSKAVIRKAIKTTLKESIKLGLRFDYGGMHAIQQGLKHCLLGPSFFAENPSPVNTFVELRDKDESTPPSQADISQSTQIPHLHNSGTRKFVNIITLGGHLLPPGLLRNNARHTRISWEVRSSELLRTRTALYGEGLTIKKYTRNNKRFFSGLWEAAKLYATATISLTTIQKRYTRSTQSIKSRSYWNSKLHQTK